MSCGRCISFTDTTSRRTARREHHVHGYRRGHELRPLLAEAVDAPADAPDDPPGGHEADAMTEPMARSWTRDVTRPGNLGRSDRGSSGAQTERSEIELLMSLPSPAGSCRPEPEASPAPTSPPSRSHPRRPAGGEACCRIPTRFDEVADRSFCFVHVDVDLFEPTRESIAFFYPRMVPGGVMLFDDYGFVVSRRHPRDRRVHR